MAATDRRTAEADPSAVAGAIRETDLCHLLARADGDALAAAAVLADACDELGVPYHVGVVRTRAELEERLAGADPGAEAIVLGAAVRDHCSLSETPASARAFEAVRELGVSPDPVTALAGVVAAGDSTGGHPTILEAADLDRRPGLGVPTDDPVEGLAHSTLVHCEFSGESERARRAIADLDVERQDEEARRKIASLLAMSVAGDPDGTSRGAETVERALRPHGIDGPVATLEGYADILSALAHEAPGVGVALALGSDLQNVALSTWRDHAARVHEAVRDATPARYDGLVVARVDGPVETTARLLRDYRSPEPVALAIDGDRAAVAGIEPVAEALEGAVDRAGGSALAAGRTGSATAPGTERLIDAFREEL